MGCSWRTLVVLVVVVVVLVVLVVVVVEVVVHPRTTMLLYLGQGSHRACLLRRVSQDTDTDQH